MIIGKRSLAAGEISPSLYSSTDLVKYSQGLRKMLNAYVKKSGGGESRPGSQLVRATDSELLVPPRLIEWEFNDEQTYILELGNEFIRFYKNGLPIIDTPVSILTVDGDDGANPLVITTSAAHGFVALDYIYIYGLNQIIPQGQYRVVSAPTTDTMTIRDVNGDVMYFDGGVYEVPAAQPTALGEHFTLASDFTSAQIREVRYAQNADVMVMTHNSHPVQVLTRVGPDDWDWTIADAVFGPSILPPAGTPSVSPTSGSPFAPQFYVTSVSASGEESLRSTLSTNADVTGGWQLTWSSVADAVYYNVYIQGGNEDGLVGSTVNTFLTGNWTSGSVYLVQGAAISATANNPFGAPGSYPLVCGFFEQRLWLGYTDDNIEGVWASRLGTLFNFEQSLPTQENDPVSFTPWGRKVNAIQHFLDLDLLQIFTKQSEMACRAQPITPFDIQPKAQSYNGSKDLRPLAVDGSAIYYDGREMVRDLEFSFNVDGYTGNDLTVFAAHLIEGHTLRDWCYQRSPNSIVWAVRDDGILLSLTYLREQGILAWARHDVGGQVYSVACVTENGKDVVYFVGTRTGPAFGYTIERLSDRFIDTVNNTLEDYIGMDAAYTIDGTNPDAGSTGEMTISGGTEWDENEILTLTAGSQIFLGDWDLENQIYFYPEGETPVIFTILTVNSAMDVATARPNRTVPVALRNAATAVWARASKRVRGLHHLEGQEVSIMGDGFVKASPNNPNYETVTVTDGEAVLPLAPAVKIHVGVPYLVDLETLDVDLSGASSVISKKKRVGQVTLQVEKSKGIWIGGLEPTGDDAIEYLEELKLRQFEDYQNPTKLLTGKAEVIIRPEWNSNGRVFIRVVDPLPMSVVGIFAEGDYPFGGG